MLVACDSGIRTATVPAGVAPVSARAWIHGRHEHKVSREGHVSLCPTDGHKPVLQRLPDRLKHRVRELAQLIEEEHTPVAQCQVMTLRARSTYFSLIRPPGRAISWARRSSVELSETVGSKPCSRRLCST